MYNMAFTDNTCYYVHYLFIKDFMPKHFLKLFQIKKSFILYYVSYNGFSVIDFPSYYIFESLWTYSIYL